MSKPDHALAEIICCGCLATEGRLYSFADKRLGQAFLQLTGLEDNGGALCYICLNLLRKFTAFRSQCHYASDWLKNIKKINKSPVNLHNFVKTNVLYINIDGLIPNTDIVQPNLHKCDERGDSQYIYSSQISQHSIKVEPKEERTWPECINDNSPIPENCLTIEFLNDDVNSNFNKENEVSGTKVDETADFIKENKIEDKRTDDNKNASKLVEDADGKTDGNDEQISKSTHTSMCDKTGRIFGEIVGYNEIKDTFNKCNDKITNNKKKSSDLNNDNESDSLQKIQVEEKDVKITDENNEETKLAQNNIFDNIFDEVDEMSNTKNDVASKITRINVIDISSDGNDETTVTYDDSNWEPQCIEIRDSPEREASEFNLSDNVIKLHPNVRFNKSAYSHKVKRKTLRNKAVKTLSTKNIELLVLTNEQMKNGNITELVKQQLERRKAEMEQRKKDGTYTSTDSIRNNVHGMVTRNNVKTYGLKPALQSKVQANNGLAAELNEQRSQFRYIKISEFYENVDQNTLIQNLSCIFNSMSQEDIYECFENIYRENLNVESGKDLRYITKSRKNLKKLHLRKQIWRFLALHQQLSKMFNFEVEFLSLDEETKKMDIKRRQVQHDCTSCVQCCKEFDTIVQRIGHSRGCHNQNKAHVCRVCRYSMNKQSAFAEHLLNTHARKMTCQECGVVLQENNWFRAREHYEMHNGQMPTCDYCCSTFFNKKSLVAHIKSSHLPSVQNGNKIDGVSAESVPKDTTNMHKEVPVETKFDTSASGSTYTQNGMKRPGKEENEGPSQKLQRKQLLLDKNDISNETSLAAHIQSGIVPLVQSGNKVEGVSAESVDKNKTNIHKEGKEKRRRKQQLSNITEIQSQGALGRNS